MNLISGRISLNLKYVQEANFKSLDLRERVTDEYVWKPKVADGILDWILSVGTPTVDANFTAVLHEPRIS